MLAVVVLGFVKASVSSPPEPGFAPVMPPVFVPMVHDILLGVVTLRNKFTCAPLQMLLPVTVTVGVGLTAIDDVVETALIHPTPVKVTRTLYTPAAAVETLGTVFEFPADVEEKAAGPDQL